MAQVNQLIEKVKGMEAKQLEIRQDIEQKLKNIREQMQEKYQRNVQLMQEEYKRKLKQEVQQYISTQYLGTGPSQAMKVKYDTIISQREALETVKQMLHQTRGESRSPEMDSNYYGVHTRSGKQSRQEGAMMSHGTGKEVENGSQKEPLSPR